VRPRIFHRHFVAVVAASGLALFATGCSSPATTKSTAIIPTTNTGLCKLVNPSVVATVLSESMTFPETLVRGSTTECVYRAKAGTGAVILILYKTKSSGATFAKSRDNFERRGLQLGPITGLGDQAYYFTDTAKKTSVTTVATVKGSLQLLVTGPASLDQIGSIARYALSQFETSR